MAKASAAADVVTQLHLFGLYRDRFRSAMAAIIGVGLTDLDALEHLERLGPLTQRDLGRRLSLTSGAVTMLVDRLEQLGLARRRTHPDDRRSTLVELLPDAALPTVPELDTYHQQLHAAARALPPVSRAAVIDFLQTAGAHAEHASTLMRARTKPRPRTTSRPDR